MAQPRLAAGAADAPRHGEGLDAVIYARAMRETQERLAPLFDVLSDGARTDPDLKALSDELSTRRAGHMQLLATHLAEIGGHRQGVSVERAADAPSSWAGGPPKMRWEEYLA